MASRSRAGGTRWTGVRACSRLRLGPLSRPGTDLSNALRPPQDFGPGCARLSAPAWGSSWGWRRPDGGVGCEAESEGNLLPLERARPLPPSDSPGFVDQGAGVVLGVSCGGGDRSRETAAPQSQKQIRGSPVPCSTCWAGRGRAAARLFSSR